MISPIVVTLAQLEETVDSFNEDDLNRVPFQGSWTAGQVARHLIISNSGFLQMLHGPVKDTLRDPNQFVENIKADFLNFNIKMKNPDFTEPENIHYKKEKLLTDMGRISEGLNQAANALDLAQTCTSFELPVYGFLTRAEAIAFVLYHTQRHIHQLKNIRYKLDHKD